MNKRVFAGLTIAGVLLLAITGGTSSTTQSKQPNSESKSKSAQTLETKVQAEPKVEAICDGTTVTTDCAVDEVRYSTYLYHAAVPERSHAETTITYEKKLTGYCTLCNDGTYSPSCATGRGACSYHNGVQQWNAPQYSEVPVTNTKTVIDAPAQAAYFEKVPA